MPATSPDLNACHLTSNNSSTFVAPQGSIVNLEGEMVSLLTPHGQLLPVTVEHQDFTFLRRFRATEINPVGEFTRRWTWRTSRSGDEPWDLRELTFPDSQGEPVLIHDYARGTKRYSRRRNPSKCTGDPFVDAPWSRWNEGLVGTVSYTEAANKGFCDCREAFRHLAFSADGSIREFQRRVHDDMVYMTVFHEGDYVGSRSTRQTVHPKAER